MEEPLLDEALHARMANIRMRPKLHGRIGVAAQGLNYGGRRRAANPNEGEDGGGKKMSARNASADEEESEVAGRAWRKIGKPPVLKRGRRKANRPPRFACRPIPSKLSHRFCPTMRACH
jgi:hypothetical protein